MIRVVFNQKGGVGKSNIASNLAAISADQGYTTLLLDLDPQCNTSQYILGDELPEMENTVADFGKHIIPEAIQTQRVYSHVFHGYWEDIGTILSFFDANLDLAAVLPRFNFFDMTAPIYTRPRFLPASTINGASIDHAIIAEGCIINHCHVSQSVIGVRSVVDISSHIHPHRLTKRVKIGSLHEFEDRVVSECQVAGVGSLMIFSPFPLEIFQAHANCATWVSTRRMRRTSRIRLGLSMPTSTSFGKRYMRPVPHLGEGVAQVYFMAEDDPLKQVCHQCLLDGWVTYCQGSRHTMQPDDLDINYHCKDCR